MTGEPRRRGGRAARRKLRAAAPMVSAPTLVRNIPLYEVLHAEGVALIDDASMNILEQVGIAFRDPEALEIWRAAVREIGPGGHFLGAALTRKHFETAFFMPELLDNNSDEQWLDDGSRDANTRALEKVKAMLAASEAPPIDPAIDEALRAFIAEREAELSEGVA